MSGRVMMLVVAIATLDVACEPRHIRAHTPRERRYEVGDYEAADNGQSPGSIWRASQPGLFEDLRAARVGDILTVVIDEESKGQGDATTKLNKESSFNTGISELLGLVAAFSRTYPDLNPESLVKMLGESDFAGDGATSRTGKLEAKIAARVKQVMPNGDLFIEGDKVILLNEEELHFYVSGVIRASDVQPDNSIKSSLIADAQVEFSGRRVVADQQKPGWLHQIVDKYNPM